MSAAAEQRTLEHREAREAMRQFFIERRSQPRARLTHVVTARVSKEEGRAIDRVVARSKMTASKFIRTVLAAVSQGDDVYEALRPRKARENAERTGRVDGWNPSYPDGQLDGEREREPGPGEPQSPVEG